MITRMGKIEALLAEWFRGEGFSVSEGYAFIYSYEGDGSIGDKFSFDVACLAEELDREFDRIVGATK